jgi:hypothetical protein
MKLINIRYKLALVIIICIAACNSNSDSNKPITDTTAATTTDTAMIITPVEKGDVVDTLYKLSFIKESNRYLDSLTKHKHGIAFIVDTAATTYNVTAGYNGDLRFETYYTLTIDKKTKEIKVQDVISGDMVSPAEFEKRRKANK